MASHYDAEIQDRIDGAMQRPEMLFELIQGNQDDVVLLYHVATLSTQMLSCLLSPTPASSPHTLSPSSSASPQSPSDHRLMRKRQRLAAMSVSLLSRHETIREFLHQSGIVGDLLRCLHETHSKSVTQCLLAALGQFAKGATTSADLEAKLEDIVHFVKRSPCNTLAMIVDLLSRDAELKLHHRVLCTGLVLLLLHVREGLAVLSDSDLDTHENVSMVLRRLLVQPDDTSDEYASVVQRLQSLFGKNTVLGHRGVIEIAMYECRVRFQNRQQRRQQQEEKGESQGDQANNNNKGKEANDQKDEEEEDTERYALNRLANWLLEHEADFKLGELPTPMSPSVDERDRAVSQCSLSPLATSTHTHPVTPTLQRHRTTDANGHGHASHSLIPPLHTQYSSPALSSSSSSRDLPHISTPRSPTSASLSVSVNAAAAAAVPPGALTPRATTPVQPHVLELLCQMGFDADLVSNAVAEFGTFDESLPFCLSVQETLEFLRQQQLSPSIVKLFAENNVRMEDLPTLQDRDLYEMGVTAVGDRLRIRNAIENKKHLSRTSALDLAVLHTNPLVQHIDPTAPLFPLNIDQEHASIQEALQESNRRVRALFGLFTADSFLHTLTKGVQLLHIMGHGQKDHLVMEDGKGGLHAVSSAMLTTMLQSGSRNRLKFVLISSCYAQQAAMAFVNAGVPHVVAAQGKIRDEFAIAFARQAYLSLAQGNTVKDAFNDGLRGVMTAEDQLHEQEDTHQQLLSPSSDPTHNSPRAQWFKLLPETADHDVRLFISLPVGQWTDQSPPPIHSNLVGAAHDFLGRSHESVRLVNLALDKQHPLIVVHSPPGYGRTSVVTAVGKYINERRHFRGGVFYFPLTLEHTTSDDPESLICSLFFNEPRLRPLFSSPDPPNVYDSLRGGDRLFILDDVHEFSSGFRSLINNLCQNCQMSVLCTSRHKLEHVDCVAAKDFPLHALRPSDAVMLFLQRMSRPIVSVDMPEDMDMPRSIEGLLQHPLFTMLHGVPKLIQMSVYAAAELNLMEVVHALTSVAQPDTTEFCTQSWPRKWCEHAPLVELAQEFWSLWSSSLS